MQTEFQKFQLNQESIAQALAKALNLPYLNFQITKPEIDALKYITKEQAEKAKAIPFKKEGKSILIAVVDPYNQNLLNLKESLEKQGFNVRLAIISPASFDIGLDQYKFLQKKSVSYAGIFEINKDVLKEVNEKINKKEELQDLIQKFITDNPFIIFP